MKLLNLLPSPDQIRLGSLEIIDFSSFMELFGRFTLNFIVIMVLVRWLYYTTTRRKDYLFTYILISSVVFLLCYLLESVKLQIGFALGLFAIFGIIRYRTNDIPIKEMTYLFLIIGVSVINSLADDETSLAEILFTNGAIIFATYGLEKLWLLRHESSKIILYEKIDLIRPENYDLLVKDLKERTGISKIKRVEVGKIDFLRDTCFLTIYYEEKGKGINITDQIGEIKNYDNND
ncbi:MAG TPA: DUF4956 domain-containing protein [Bacteroidales bacterium]|mgnify:CR=1 FL=1|nr:DUF4956 domain-containing protein [Bacteroidales bacterium]HPF03561.1 DUF4956 domain-containing protein [Bacteroidales bacterium]HPJ60468.1 DUF4956 domain-containing protein [Bacteroidales bacterium]HPR11179.1 DUF4956 domain-containing protein [Bacteroidales bacterium]HRW86215.1 DUF4956 domain-containing protein [Bacteroidales bacterium]